MQKYGKFLTLCLVKTCQLDNFNLQKIIVHETDNKIKLSKLQVLTNSNTVRNFLDTFALL